ncbi:hypothetical protein DH2020_043373 [Rehmannia glutinosa]|uniref:Uncharacterized protein n=1 Tax=Rehmannia glutinosa TaxID=99300 RepID=A0ABR0UKX0_REHGL
MVLPNLRKFVLPQVAKHRCRKIEEDTLLVGEDSAEFVLSKQKISSWVYFTGILGVVLYILDVAWIDNSTGYGKVFIDALSSISDSPELPKETKEVAFCTSIQKIRNEDSTKVNATSILVWVLIEQRLTYRRLAIRYGEAFEAVKNRTSVIPFAAILDGRQKLPEGYLGISAVAIFLNNGIDVRGLLRSPTYAGCQFRLHW